VQPSASLWVRESNYDCDVVCQFLIFHSISTDLPTISTTDTTDGGVNVTESKFSYDGCSDYAYVVSAGYAQKIYNLIAPAVATVYEMCQMSL
jgi:hypothetical protein